MKTTFTLFVVCVAVANAHAQSTAFTYQGRLTEGGLPAVGQLDLRFTLRDAPTNGANLGSVFLAPVPVDEGRFTVSLDFGGAAFTGAARWLEIGVRTNGSVAPYTFLAPYQPLLATPMAQWAKSASNVTGVIGDAQMPATVARLGATQAFSGRITLTNTGNLVGGNGSNLIALNASALAYGTVPDARLATNLARLNSNQVFTATNRFAGVTLLTNAANLVAGDGSGLANLNAAALAGGTFPDARLSANVPRLNSNQIFTGNVAFNPVTGPPFAVSNSALVANLNADLLDGLTAAAFWAIGGNSGTTNGNFLGTTDNQPLDFRVNGARALRVVPTAGTPNLIGGSVVNTIASNTVGAVIGGGQSHSITGNFAVVSGGSANAANAVGATVGGGQNNIASGVNSVVPGGAGNNAVGAGSFAAGQGANALHSNTLVWADGSSLLSFNSAAANSVIFRAAGGVGIGTNSPQSALHVAGTVQAGGLKLPSGALTDAVLTSDAGGNAAWALPPVRQQTNSTSPNLLGGLSGNTVAGGVVGAVIGGGGSAGATNLVGGSYGVVAGGQNNRALGTNAVVSGGLANTASNGLSVVSGGSSNVAAFQAAVVGGSGNRALGTASFIGGGVGNAVTNSLGVIGGGQNNVAGNAAAVGGGVDNIASGYAATIAGGNNNRGTGDYSALAGGVSNTNTAFASFIGAGTRNMATNSGAMVPGGYGNVAGGVYSFAAGTAAQALHPGSFVWADFSTVSPFASTAPNQFLIRATGGVGIGGAPVDAALDVEGNVRLNDYDLFLRGGTDRNYGLGYYGPSKPFATVQPDGPVLYGWEGGALGSKNGGERIALRWNSAGNVGIGTASPVNPLHVLTASGFVSTFESSNPGGTSVTLKNTGGGDSWNLVSTGSGNGEGAGHLIFYDGSTGARTILKRDGRMGIGTTAPGDHLEVAGGDATIRIHNSNDGVLGGFVENTWSTLQLGMFSEGGAVGQVPGGAKRSFFGVNADGLVGSLNNIAGQPAWRNLLDDGVGNLSVNQGGAVNFGYQVRQMVNLWGTAYGIGVQSGTLYCRTDGSYSGAAFVWYKGGLHADNQYDPGGGDELMRLNSGGLTVNGSFISSSDRARKSNFAPVNPRQVLERVALLPIQRWSYTNDPAATPHLGPMAQDFHAAFGVGPDDKHIAMIDADGVALAAIQGLNQKLDDAVKAKDAEILHLKQSVAELKALVNRLATQAGRGGP